MRRRFLQLFYGVPQLLFVVPDHIFVWLCVLSVENLLEVVIEECGKVRSLPGLLIVAKKLLVEGLPVTFLRVLHVLLLSHGHDVKYDCNVGLESVTYEGRFAFYEFRHDTRASSTFNHNLLAFEKFAGTKNSSKFSGEEIETFFELSPQNESIRVSGQLFWETSSPELDVEVTAVVGVFYNVDILLFT